MAKRVLNNFGFLVTFDLGSEAAAKTFLSTLKVISEATSFGGLHSMAERRARWQPSTLTPGTIRLSVGCEDTADLIDDLAQALAAIQ